MKRLVVAILLFCLLLGGCVGTVPVDSDPSLDPNPPVANQGISALRDANDGIIRFAVMFWDGYDAEFEARATQLTNELLAAKGIMAKIEFINYSSDGNIEALGADIVLLLNVTGLDLENTYDYNARMDKLYDITDAIQKSPALYEQVPKSVWYSMGVEGKICGFPVLYTQRSYMESSIGYIRSDILEMLGLPVPKSIEELYEVCALAQEAGLDCQLANYFEAVPYEFHRQYDAWPFYVDGPFLYSADGTVSSYLESDIYKQDASWLHKFNDAGLLKHIGDSSDSHAGCIASFWPMQTVEGEFIEGLTSFQIAPEKEAFPTDNMAQRVLAVLKNSQTPELAMQVLTAIYTDAEVHDAIVFGEEGVDYEVDSDGMYRSLIKNNNVVHLEQGTFAKSIEYDFPRIPVYFANISDFPAPQFLFQDVQELFWPLLDSLAYSGGEGVLACRAGLAAEELFDARLEELKQIGLDELIRQCNEQYQKYLAQR